MKIKIEQIHPSKTNPRTTFDEGELKELATSIKERGIEIPITVRESKEYPAPVKYEIVCGERRWRASKIAGVTEIEANVRDLSDDTVKEIQLIEFAHTKDIHPLDEAEGLQKLLGKTGRTIDVAMKIGKPVSYVEQKLKLTALIDPAKKAFRAGALTLGHAILICRLQPADQKRAFEFAMKNWQKFEGDYEYGNSMNPDIKTEDDPDRYGDKDAARTVCSVKDLKEFIELRINLDLKEAAFDVKDATLLEKAGSCIDCPKRTGFNKELFNDIGRGDFCTDANCFHAKQQAFLERLKSGLKKTKQKYVEITKDQRKPDGHPGAMTERSFKYVKGKPCKFARTGIFIDADSKGKTALVCSAKKECKIHFAGYTSNRLSGNDSRGEKPKTPEQIEKQRIEQVHQQINSEVANQMTGALLTLIAKNIPGKAGKEFYASLFDYCINQSYYAADIKGLLSLKGKTKDQNETTLIKMLNLFLIIDAHENTFDGSCEDLIEKAKSLKVDIKTIEKEIREKVEKEHAEELKSQLPKSQKPEPTKTDQGDRGTCRICGCTEEKACTLRPEGDKPIRPCSWADKSETLCNNPKCLEAVRKLSKAKALAKPTPDKRAVKKTAKAK